MLPPTNGDLGAVDLGDDVAEVVGDDEISEPRRFKRRGFRSGVRVEE